MIYLILVTLTLWCAGRLALRREGRRARHVLEVLLAPFGRVRTLPAGAAVLTAKRYRYGPHVLTEPARVWVGWWNCRSFPASDERYYFFHRQANCAVRVDTVR